jgi:tetratricopeptide (TPR) repeat protein
MALIEIPFDFKSFSKDSREYEILKQVEATRKVASQLEEEGRYRDAFERTVDGLRQLRTFPNFDHDEFRAMLVALLFDLATINYALKDYKQSEKEIEVLFKVLNVLVKKDSERFAPLHILAMDLSTRILRSRRKAMDMLARQQVAVAALYDKVNAGMVAATDKLVDSLCKVAQLLSASGDYKASLKFYAEAIKFSKKRAGKVTRKEVKMTLDMAGIMMRIRSMRPRAKRLLEALLPHAITLGTIELEEDILALIEVIDADAERESAWKTFLRKISFTNKEKGDKHDDEQQTMAPDLHIASDEKIIRD